MTHSWDRFIPKTVKTILEPASESVVAKQRQVMAELFKLYRGGVTSAKEESDDTGSGKAAECR